MSDHVRPETFDLIIVGSGTGNSIPDFLADRRIALVERGVFGGTCLNRGCIPSKMFVYPADVALSATTSARLDIRTNYEGVDWPALRARVFGRIDPISAGGREYRASGTPNVTLIEGTARFVASEPDLHTMSVDGRMIAAPQVLVGTGSRPVIPDIQGLTDVGFHTSDSIMRLDRFPNRLGIIGGGFIAVEMGHVFSGLGSDVTIFNRSNRLLGGFDADIAARFVEVFGQRVDLRLGQIPTAVERVGRAIRITSAGGSAEVDELLVAVGREPNSDLICADVVGLATRDDGTIRVDDTMATNVRGIWAIGDVANSYQLKHLANAEGRVAFWNIAHPDDLRHQSYKAVPSAVFSNPQVATVGLTEEEARHEGHSFRVGARDYGGTAYGWAMEDTTGFAKVLVDSESGLVIGAHVIGPQASTLIQPLIQAMELGQTAEQIARDVLYIHPALTEVVENALLAALD